MSKGEKLTKKKKLIISLSAVFGALIIIGAIILGLFCPRKLLNYIDLEAKEVDAIYISYGAADGNSKQVYLDDNKKDLFFDFIENIRVVPQYLNYKVETTYRFYITSGGTTYSFNSLKARKFENHEIVSTRSYYVYSGKVYNLVYLFDISEEDMKYI